MQLQPSNPEPPLVCRPDQSLWFLVVIFMALALILPVTIWTGFRPLTAQDDVWAVIAFCAMPGIPALCTAWFLMHCRILADARGLTFRGFLASRFVAWNAIEDYELRVPTAQQSKSRTPRAYFQTGGKWRPLRSSFTGCTKQQPLLDLIERRATASHAQSWQVGDLRDDGEWPKVFEYHDKSGWKLVGMYLGMALLFFSQYFTSAITTGFAPIFANIALIWSGLSPWGRVGFVATPLLLCGSLPLMVLTEYPAILARRRYLGQKIIATREEISLLRDGRRLSLAWDEIESYHLETLPGNFQPSKCIIETRRARIEFLTGISGTKSLLALVQNRAKNASTSQWLHLNGADEDVLGGAASFYRGGNVGVGPKTHHYRTRMSRIFLIFGLFMVAAFIFQLHTQSVTGRLNNGQPVSGADTFTQVFLLVSMGAATLWALLSITLSAVCCEADGLRQRSVFGERFARWDEIETFRVDAPYFTVKSRKCTLRYGTFIADARGLREEIERRSGIKCQRESDAFRGVSK